ncbi:MAG: SBBP repeat-containing protein, partial [Candidatus Acidiferrales bacterium]
MRNANLSMRSPKPFRWVAPLFATIGLAAVMLYCATLWTLAAGGTSEEPVHTTPSRTGNSQKGGLESLATLKSEIPAKNRVAEQYGKLPLSFEMNRGQSDHRVKFMAHGNGYALFLTPNEAVFSLSKPSASGEGKKVRTNAAGEKNSSAATLRMNLGGANPAAKFAALDELPGKSNYFIGNNPAGWHTDVPNFRKVAERGIYPGIDLIYYGTQRQLEYDFVVAPGADPGAIQLGFRGAEKIRTNSNGELVVSIAEGEVILHKPVAYQEANGERRLVAAEFELNAAQKVTFRMGKYDSRLPVVIDPILSYSTYLGGTGIDVANAIAVATDGTAFVVGSTHSIDFPTTHSLQPDHGGPDDFPQDAFVTKLSADGKTLLYSTYLGGENQDFGNGIAVDTFGNAYVTGTTFSPHFPVTLPIMNPSCGGDGKCGATFNIGGAIVSNAFVAELNTAGSELRYSTFLGFYEDVTGNAIAVDATGNAYVTGQTTPKAAVTVVITPPAPEPAPFPIVNGFKGNTPSINGPDLAAITNAYIAK